jgi:hypothetical protein
VAQKSGNTRMRRENYRYLGMRQIRAQEGKAKVELERAPG